MYTNNNLDEEEDEKSRLKPSATDSPLVTTYKSQIWDFKRKIQSYEEALRQRDECISQLRSQIVDGDEGDYDAAVSNIRLGMQRSREQVRTAISDRDYAESVAAASKEQLKHGEAAWKESEDNLRRQTVPLDEYEGRLKDVREEYNDKITKIRHELESENKKLQNRINELEIFSQQTTTDLEEERINRERELKKHRLLAEQYGNDVLALQEKLKELEKTKRTAEKALQEERGQLRIKVETIEHLEGKVTALEANCASLQEANALERKNSGDIHGILRTQQEQFQRLKALMDAKIASLEQEKIQRLEDYEQIKRQLLKLEEERQRRSREQDETRQLRQQQKQLRRLFEALKKGTSEELEDLLEEFLPRDASQDTFLSNGEIGSISEASLGTSRGTHDENDNSECSLHAGLLMQNVVALVRQKVRASAEKEELLNRLESLMPLSVAAGSDEGDGRTIVERLSGELASKKQLEELLTDWLGANGDFSGIVERLKERIQAEEELREFLDEKPETLFTTVVNDARKAVISKENQLREALQELAEVRAWTSEQDALLKQIGMVLEVENIQDVVEVKKIADTLRNTQWRLKDAEETVGRMARELRERMIQLEAAEMDSREKEQLLVRAREEVTEKVGRIGDLEGQLKEKDALVLSSNQRVAEWELAVRGLEKQVAEQRLAKETSEREAEALREKVEYAESLKGQLEQEVLEGKAKIEEEMMKIQRLENDLNAKEEEVGFLVAAQSKAEEDLKEIREELRQVQEQLEGERSAKEHLKLEWSGELENEKAEKRRLLTEFEGRINVITTECEKRVNKIETELEDWKGNFRECESHLNEASQENCDLRKKISVMDGSIEKLKDTQEKLEAENEKLRGELKDVCLQDSRLRRSLEGEVEDLKKSVDDLQKKKAQLEAENQVLAAEVDGLRKSHAEAEKSLSVLDGRFRTLESLHASLCEDKTCFEQSILELLSAVSAEMGEKFLQQVKREDQDFRLCAVSQFLKDFLMKDLKAVQSALGMAEGEFRVEDLWGVVEELKRRGEERDELDRELQRVKEERGREARLMEAVEEQMEKATKELQLMEEERKKQEEAWREELESYKRRLSPEMSLSVGMSHALVVDLLRYFRISTTVLPAAPCQPPDPADGGDKECHALGRGGVFGRRESPDGGEIESPRSEVPVSLSSGLTPPVEVDPLPPPAAPVASGREEEEDAKDIGSEDADGMEDLELTFQRIQAQVRRATSVLLAQGGHDPASQGPVPPDPYSLAVDLSWQPPLAEADEGAREGFPSASSLLVQRIKEADVNLLNDRLEVLEEELLRAKQAKADVTGQLQAARSEIRGLHQGLQDKEREVWDLQEKVAGLVRDQDGLSRNSAVSLYSSPRASLPHCSSSVSLVSARTTGGQEMEVCFTSLPPQERCDPVDEVETQDLDPEEMDERQRNTNELIQKARALLDSSNDEFGSFDDFSREDLISRLQIYENLFAEAQLHLNEKKKTIDELGEQLHSASRHLSSREELLSQNAREWDLERESHAQEVTSLQNRVTEVEKSKEKMQNFLKEEIPSASTSPCPSSRGLRYWSKYPHHLSMVENLELQLRDLHSELLAERKRNCSAAKELSKALRMNSELRDTMVALEGQLKEARQRERAFQQEKDQLKEELQRLSAAHDELKQDWELLHAALMSSSHPSASSSASLLRDEEFEEDVASGDGADMSLMQEIRRVNRQSSPGSQDDDESTLEGGDNSADTTVPADSAASRPSSARDGSSPALPHPNGPTDDHGIDAIQKEFAMERAIWSAELTSARQKICVLKGALDEQKMRKDDSEELRKELKLLKRELHQARTELMAREKQLRGNEYRLAESRVLVTQRSQPEHLADAEQRASSDDQGSQSSPLRSSEDNAASVSSENSRKCGGFDSSSIPSESDTSLLGPKETSTPRGARRTKASQSQRKRRDKVASPGESGGQVSDGSLFAAEEVLRRRLSFAASDADRDLQFTQDPGSSSRHRIVPRVLDPKSVFLTDEESHKCPPEEDLEFLTPDSFDEVHHGSQTLSAGFRRQRESAEPGESVPNHIEAGNEDFRFLDEPRPFRLPTQESVELRNRIRNLEEENQELKRIIERKTLTLEERSEEVHSLEEELVRRQQEHQESQNRLLEVQAKYLTTLEAKASLSDTVQTMTAEEGSRKKESIRLRDQLRSMQALIEANSKAAEGAKKEKKKVLEELQKLRTEKDQVISRLSEYSERVSEGKSLLQEKLSEKEQEVEALKEQLQEKITQEQRNKIAQEQRNKIAQEQRNKREEEEAPSLEGLTERLNQEVATSTALDRKLFSLFRSEDPSTSSTLSYGGTTSSEENEEDGPAGGSKEGRAKGQRHAPGVASGSGEEVETVRKIQRLLRRVHKEGRQVLALSELPSPSPSRKSAASPSASRNGKTGTDARTKDPTSANGNKTQGATGSTPPEANNGGHCEECKKLREKSFQSVAMVKQLREKDEEIKSLKSHLKKQEENYRLFTEKIDKFLDVQKELDEEESKARQEASSAEISSLQEELRQERSRNEALQRSVDQMKVEVEEMNDGDIVNLRQELKIAQALIMRLKAQTDRQAAEHEKELRNQSVRWRNEVEQEAQRLREDQGELASSALVEELQRENGRLKKESEEMNMFLLETVEKKLELEKMVGVLHGQLERSSQPCSDSEASYPTHLSVALRESEKEASRLREQLSLLQAVLDEGAFHQGGVQTGTGEVNMGTLIYVFHKFEREQSYRRNLAYQKKYLIVLLRKLKADLARHAGGVAMNPAFQSLILAGVVLSRGRRTFRIYVFVVIAIRRMEYLVRLWKRRYRVAIQEGASSPTHLVVPPHSPRSQSPSPMRHDRASVARTRGSRSRERPPLPGGSDNVRLLRRIEESISQSQDVLLSHSTPPSSPFRANCLRRPEAPRGAYGDDAPTATVYQQQRHNWDGGEPLYHITGRTPPTRDKRDKSKRRLISPPRRSSSPDSVRSSQSSSTPIPLNDVLGCGRGITNVSIPVPLSFGAPQSQFRNSRLQQPSMRLWSRPAD